MSSVNYQSSDQTVILVDNFYKFELKVDSNLYDVVLSTFKNIIDNEQAAKNFAMSLFKISNDNNIPVLTLLQELENQDQLEITRNLAYYLNNNRSNSTLLGVSSIITPNKYVARNVKQ